MICRVFYVYLRVLIYTDSIFMISKDDSKGNFIKNFHVRHPILSNLIMIVVAGLVLLWAIMIFLDVWTQHGSTEEVPDVKMLTYEEARKVLTNYGFQVEIADSVYDDKKAPSTVLESWPRAGAIVKPGREVFLTITSFQPRKVKITMPLKDVSSRQALSYLESLGIKNVRIVSVHSQYADLVLGAKYNGKDITNGMLLPVNALVVLEVGTVPDVTELDVRDALDYSGSADEQRAPESSPKDKTSVPELEDEPSSSSFYD